jgi:hypothetical protein
MIYRKEKQPAQAARKDIPFGVEETVYLLDGTR